MTSISEIARSISGHRFEDAFEHLADDVVWIVRGAEGVTGKQAVIDACRATADALAETVTEFREFRSVATEDVVVVDAVAEYRGTDGDVSIVASCDLYDFADGLLVRITSYNVELDA